MIDFKILHCRDPRRPGKNDQNLIKKSETKNAALGSWIQGHIPWRLCVFALKLRVVPWSSGPLVRQVRTKKPYSYQLSPPTNPDKTTMLKPPLFSAACVSCAGRKVTKRSLSQGQRASRSPPYRLARCARTLRLALGAPRLVSPDRKYGAKIRITADLPIEHFLL